MALLESRQKVQAIRVNLNCNKCNGKMEFNGMTSLSLPPKYNHECKKCGNIIRVNGKTYPCIEYEDIPENTSGYYWKNKGEE